MDELIKNYKNNLVNLLNSEAIKLVSVLATDLKKAWENGNKVFICGNGGSAANAIHLANDFIFGINPHDGIGMKVEALTANPAIITCLANDIGYDLIFAHQLKVKANKDDILIVLSGSGNSKNILEVIKVANEMGIKSFGIIGFSGGEAKKLLTVPMHFEINDMQVSEDLQMIVGHMCMQWLSRNVISYCNNQEINS